MPEGGANDDNVEPVEKEVTKENVEDQGQQAEGADETEAQVSKRPSAMQQPPMSQSPELTHSKEYMKDNGPSQ